MVSSGSFRKTLGATGAVLWLLAVSVGATFAADSGTCEVRVEPRAASGGSVFVFSGSGFKPVTLVLQKESDEPIAHDINVGDADPWSVTVRSRAGDEGTWTASFTNEEALCTATATFRVTLTNTDAVTDLAAAVTSARSPILLYLAVVVIGFGSGTLIGRRMYARVRA
jgi:hypothetical protein